MSFYGTLLGGHGCSFRIRHENSPVAPPDGEITMTLYPVGNQTSLSRKPCIPDKKFIWNGIRKSWSLFHNPSYKIGWSAPWRINHDDVISGCNQTSLSGKPCIPDKKLIWSLFQNPSCKIVWSAPWRRSDYYVGNTTSLSRKTCMVAKKLLWIINWKSWSLFQNTSWKSVCSVPWRRTGDDVVSSWQ